MQQKKGKTFLNVILLLTLFPEEMKAMVKRGALKLCHRRTFIEQTKWHQLLTILNSGLEAYT